ncbi:MAG: response regulator [Rhodospirillales bacterium]|nr:response regulator [Rhodospirillales bacterium]MCW9001588.1 response regulator [Rhodospirillales bacterium]MCW9038890.1 response regulator [Rhodospirillales bacterium]
MTKKLRLFVVDDDPSALELILTILRNAGHEAEGTNDSLSAVKRVAEFKPDGVLVDLMMPGMDGYELCEKLRETRETAGVKIIVVSGKVYEFDRKRAYKFGADGYITKPLEATSLVEQVSRVIENKMELTFWGVRGTLPVPGERTLRYGGNTSCISLRFPKGQLFIFDAGTGIKNLADSLMKRRLTPLSAKIFISHPHWDHINALPFFTPLYIPGNEFEILGSAHGDVSLREMISAQMDGVYFPITLKEFGARVYFHDLREEELVIDGIKVTTKLLNHPGKCLGYRVDHNGHSVCYVTDNELFDEDSDFHNPFYIERLSAFIAGADILITDSTYTDQEYKTKIGWGHSSINQVVNLADRAGVKTLYLFHHDPDQDDDDIDAKLAIAQSILKERGSTTVCVAPREGDIINV